MVDDLSRQMGYGGDYSGFLVAIQSAVDGTTLVGLCPHNYHYNLGTTLFPSALPSFIPRATPTLATMPKPPTLSPSRYTTSC